MTKKQSDTPKPARLSIKTRIQKNSKRRWIIGGVVSVCVLLIAVLGWYAVSYLTLLQQVNGVNQDMSQNVEAAATTLKTSPDTTRTMTQLGGLASKLQEERLRITASALTSGQQEKLTHIVTAFGTAMTAVYSARNYLSYQDHVAAVLKRLSTLSGKDQDHLIGLSAGWQQALVDIKKQTPPAEAISFHNQLVQKVQLLSDSMAMLVNAYQKMDQTTYTSKKQAIVGGIGDLQKLAGNTADIAKNQDKAVSTALANLKDALSSV